jgi:phosphate transport system substrate-binding protein
MRTRTRTRTKGFLGTACFVALLTATVLVAGCGGSSSDGTSEYSGNVKVSGSTTVLPLAQEAAAGFMDANSDANVDVQGGGSSVGITQVKEGVVNIGTSSRDLKPEENSDNSLVPTKIALDVIAMAVNPNVTVDNLTRQQASDIFTGRITNWKDVGGADASIIVVVRDKASGTREMFDQKVLGTTSDKPVEPVASAIECNANGIMRETVASKPNSIGYLSLGYVNNKLKAVNLDGVVPSLANALNKSYSLSRFLYMVTKGEPGGTVKGYIDYVLSDQFQNDVVATEYIPIKQAQ